MLKLKMVLGFSALLLIVLIAKLALANDNHNFTIQAVGQVQNVMVTPLDTDSDATTADGVSIASLNEANTDQNNSTF